MDMKIITRQLKRVNTGVWFVLPAVFVVLIFAFYPLVYNFAISLTNAGSLISNMEFRGFDNYIDHAQSKVFWQATKQTLIFASLSITMEMGAGLGAALLFRRPGRGRGFLIGVVLASWATSYMVTAIIGRWMFDGQLGVINDMLIRLSIINDPVYWLAKPATAMFAVTFMNAWKHYPFVMLMYLAALQAIPVELYEAAMIDGASVIKKFWYVTLPMLRSVTGAALFLTTIWALNAFTIVWAMTGGGPMRKTETLPILIYRIAFKTFKYGSAAAASIYLFAIVLILAIGYLYMGRNTDYEI